MSEDKISASCAWGDGPDVIVALNGTRVILYENPTMKGWVHGYVENGSFDLTSEEAINLAIELLRAATGAEEMEESLKAYMDNQEKKEEDEKNE